ncbi:Alpha-1,3-mannosyltransferase MNN1 [Colletotrichum trifolii]|uniref:Alpha-1,3-mannosyltransferase MNN1 n=1 Tax=Colletotrichum trifolii TaxID=5466 RepID=A0A4V3HXH3_COLTR|nr:Alpha-1,3-mannosyltransferase MNN1 [Colletotrichum trifolii]
MVVVTMPSVRMATTVIALCLFLMFVYSTYLLAPSHHLASPTPQEPKTRPASQPPSRPEHHDDKPKEDVPSAWQKEADSIVEQAKILIQDPIRPPYKDRFYDLGQRVMAAREWVKFIDNAPRSAHTRVLAETVEAAIASCFPFIQNSPKHPNSKNPFSDLRSSFVPGSRGLVIPTGKGTMRYATHLIGSLQEILHSNMTIQIVYAGDEDLPPAEREKLHSRFKDVLFLDIFSVIDDTTLQLVKGGWAIKAFAALYAPFEEVLLSDADSVFVQVPESLFLDPSYATTGALLFHDRLIWQHAYAERHDWYKSQIHEPSAALNKSLVWTEDYAEEGDSGVVVVDKSRLDVLMGLLHVAWQNTYEVREEVTYKLTYGDKETWWLGLELSAASYAFEKHYGAMIGWFKEKVDEAAQRICSFVIGHVDVRDELIWYNGGLLKNKKLDPNEFGLPTHTLVGGTWEKGADRTQMSCMVGPNVKPLSRDMEWILNSSITLAQELDREFGFV